MEKGLYMAWDGRVGNAADLMAWLEEEEEEASQRPCELRKVAEVRWVDSFHDAGWSNRGEILGGDHKAGICCSIGYVIEDTEDWLGLAQSYTEGGQLGNVLRIPKVAIKSSRNGALATVTHTVRPDLILED